MDWMDDSDDSTWGPSGDVNTDINLQIARDKALEVFKEFYRDFRRVPSYPTQSEIHYNLSPPVRPNRIHGNYPNVNTYLDIHFKLLREDLNRFLRRGIHTYRNLAKSGEEIPRIGDIRIYTDVTIGRRSDRSLNSFNATFSAKAIGDIDWEHSKRLIYGSLLCLSSNNFDTFCYATVAGNRDPEELAKGRFELEFVAESMSDEFRYNDPKTKFVMIESSVYYEAYKYVLSRLKQLNAYNLPFKKCLIDLNKSNTLNEANAIASKVFDLSIMVFHQTQHLYRNVRLRALNQWPSAQQMLFDDYQYYAFRSAFLRQFVLIQGPPGTGKTYVGLKIVQTLQKNRFAWNTRERQKPIVIICYTNHALDQFLEGVRCFCPRQMVRIGTRSKSEDLKRFTLNSIKRSRKNNDKLLPPNLINNINFTLKEMRKIRQKISELDVEINNSRTDLKYLEKLEEILYNQLRPFDSHGFKLANINGRRGVLFVDMDMKLQLNCSQNFLEWFNSERDQTRWFSNQMEYLRRNYSNELNIAVIKWLVGCEYDSEDSSDEDNINDIQDNEPKKLKVEEDDTLVKREEDDRDIDSDNDSEYNFGELYKKVSEDKNRDNKTFKQISKRVMKQFKKYTSSEPSDEDVMEVEEAKQAEYQNLSQLDYEDRYRLYWLWRKIYKDSKIARFEALTKRYDLLEAEHKRLSVLKTYHLIRDKQIIGMTTTGASKNSELLKLIDPKIVVVEEAAEVLECHVVTALTANTDHLILIGDHKQLRAKANVFALIKFKSFDVSLFERMINNGMPYQQLKYQHRMRPEMTKLIRPLIYRDLYDHESVFHYENVRGMSKNMFFLDHDKPEKVDDERMSKCNPFEAHLIVRLAKHFLYQGYKTTEVTILTFYSSQLIQIRKLLREDEIFKIDDPKERLIATTVDNYQGEENEIILISFVRSNSNNDIGFLKIPNRVNVALSRAKKGLYCIGNFACLTTASMDLWGVIYEYLMSDNVRALGSKLELKCENHQRIIPVKDCNEFEQRSPFGGCTIQVTYCQLECGHPCSIKVCHYAGAHLNVGCKFLVLKTLDCGHQIEELCSAKGICYLPCERRLECGHICDLKCGEDCQTECNVEVDKLIEECGHTILLPCWQPCDSNQRQNCKVIVTKIFPDCGHSIEVECRLCIGQNCAELCEDEPNCGHRCNVVCKEELICGHRCHGSCHDCNQSRLHVECPELCQKRLICGHPCLGTCGQNCPPCDNPCECECPHETHTCSQPCIECLERCSSGCRHITCYRKCSQQCDICTKKCTERLTCGHQCVGLCGQICPEFCLTCDRNRLNLIYGCEDKTLGQLRGMTFIQLKVIPINNDEEEYSEEEQCRHVAELTALEAYLSNNEESVKRCPKCKSLITGCQPFKSLIQNNYQWIANKNRLYFCLDDDNKNEQKRLNELVLELSLGSYCYNFVGNFIIELMDSLRKETNSELKNSQLKILSKYQMNIIENQLMSFKELSPVLRQMQHSIETVDDLRRKFLIEFKENYIQKKFYKRVQKLLTFLEKDFVNTAQQIFDIENELKFFKLFSTVLAYLVRNHYHDNRLQVIDKLESLLSRCGGFQEQDSDLMKELLPNVALNEINVNLEPNHPLNVANN